MTFLPKKAVLGAVAALVALSVIGAMILSRSRALQPSSAPSAVLQVVATIYPLAALAEQIGGELIEVATLTPAGMEPHDYEPTPQDIAKLYNADVVLVNGNGVDEWADRLVDDLRKQGVRTVRMSDEIAASGSADPHFWLDPVLAKQSVALISRPLRALQLGAPGVLEQQVRATEASLDALHARYESNLARCERREFVTTHDAFTYLAKRYDLVQHPISAFSPTEDPSPQTMAEISDLVREKGITTIFTETLVSPKTAQAIAAETGVQTAILNPIEGITEAEQQAGKAYLPLMEENLAQLKAALQ